MLEKPKETSKSIKFLFKKRQRYFLMKELLNFSTPTIQKKKTDF